MTRIAIVDRDAELSALLTELFALEGIESVTCPPVERTVDALCALDADLIVFDGCLEGPVSDWVLLRMLRRDPRTASIPIILCSGNQRALEANAAWLESRGITTVPKPFELQQLFDVIDGRMEARRDAHALSPG